MTDQAEPKVILQMREIAARTIPDEDYQQKVDAWNEFGACCEEIARHAQLNDFRFFKNIDTSYRQQRMRQMRYVAVGAFAIISLMTFLDFVSLYRAGVTMTTISVLTDNFMGIIGAIALAPIAAGFRGKLPEKIKFSCKPKLFIDDLHFVKRYIRGLEKETNDPEVKLPEFVMEIPQKWIEQQSLLKGMETFSDLRFKLPV